MSIIYYNEDILDRILETNEISSFLSTESQQNKVLWVCGDTGLGKTSIIRKSLKTIDLSPLIIIKVETPPLNKNDCIIQGQYLNFITNSVHHEMEKYNWSMKDFLTYVGGNRIDRQEVQNVIDGGISQIPHAIISTIASRYLQTGLNDIPKILLNTDSESVLIKREYLKSVFLKGNIILYISNFHNIDMASISELEFLVGNTINNSFVFEYTTNDNNISQVLNYQELWKDFCKSAIQIIDILPLEFAVVIGGDKFEKQTLEWSNFYNDVIKGNLYKVKALKLQSNSDLSKDPLEQISKLGFQQNVLLQLIYLHGSEMNLEQLFHLLEESRQSELLVSCSKLLKELDFFIEKIGTTIKIRHASVSDYLKNSNNVEIVKASTIAYGIIRNVLNDDLCKQNFVFYTKKDIILLLIKVYAGFDTEKLLETLEHFKEIVINEIFIEQIYFLIDQVKELISNSLNKRVTLSLIRLCYEVGLYTKAYSILEEYFFPCLDIYMYKAILLNRIDRHEECVTYCEEIITYDDDTHYQFIIKLIKLLSLRTLNKTACYKQLYFEMLNNKEYRKFLEYGILLRNSQLIYSYRKNVPYIRKSVLLFKEYNSPKNELYAILTLVTEISYNGQTAKARKILKSVKQDFLQSTTEKHIIFNDIAAVDLLEKTVTNETLLSLEEGILTSHNPYDTLTILSNKICFYIISQQICDELPKMLENIKKNMEIEPDKRIHRRIYFNLHQYYQYIEKDLEKANEAWENMLHISETIDEKLNRLIKIERSNKRDIPIYISFIAYWHFDIPMIELHY